MAVSGHAATDNQMIYSSIPVDLNRASDFISGHIGALSNQVSEEVGNVPGNRYNADFEFDYHRNVNTPYTNEIERRFHVAAMVNDQSLPMYSLQEAYVGGNLTSKDHIRFGRQILPWSA